MNTDIWIDNHKDEIVKNLQELIRIKGVEDFSTSKENAPFGEGVRKTLDKALDIAGGLSLNAKDLNGYCGLIDAGCGDDMLGILCHLDVVPEGTGWDYGPYEAQIVDGKIFGRGTIDDKGPALAAIYALKAVLESGAEFKKRVRIILGCNEETGMMCLDYYKSHEEIPTMSISPDANYPVTNSEKSILHCTFEKQYKSAITMHAGEAANIIPGFASAKVGETVVEAKGIQAHASTPWEGENAVLKLITKLSEMELPTGDAEIVARLHKYFMEECYGESLGLDKTDASGRLTLNLGLVDWTENGFKMTFDLRCPISLAEEEIKEKLCAVFEPMGAELSSWSYSQGFTVPDDDPMVLKLIDVYEKRTGEKDVKPLHIGGGTYARHLPNAVSFGPEGFMCTSSCHVANEHIGVEELIFNVKMIADAIISLAC